MHLNAVLQAEAGETASFWPNVVEQSDRRRSARRSLTLFTGTRSLSTGDLSVRIRDISSTGFLIEAESDALSEGEVVDIESPSGGMVIARVVWASDRYFGCKLDEPISTGAISAALLKGDARPIEDGLTTKGSSEAPAYSRGAVRFEPELNFSVAFQLTILFYAVIGSAAYLALS